MRLGNSSAPLNRSEQLAENVRVLGKDTSTGQTSPRKSSPPPLFLSPSPLSLSLSALAGLIKMSVTLLVAGKNRVPDSSFGLIVR